MNQKYEGYIRLYGDEEEFRREADFEIPSLQEAWIQIQSLQKTIADLTERLEAAEAEIRGLKWNLPSNT